MKKFTAGFFLALLLASAIALVGQSSVYNLGPIQFQYDGSHVIATTPIVAKYDATAQAANIGTTTLYAVPANQGGMYHIIGYAVVTQAATTSSTLPALQVTYTDSDTNVANSWWFTEGTVTSNTVGNANSNVNSLQPGGIILNAKGGTNISLSSVNYASSGATPMQYAVHVKLEYLGN